MKNFKTIIGADPEAAAQWLKKGACVGIPTETVYGLAANALDPAAVVHIFAIKNRPEFDPLIVHVHSASQIDHFVSEIPKAARRLIDAFWPGPLTLLLPKTDRIPDIVTSGLSRVALRSPAHPLAIALLRLLDFPLAAPSANPFGYISPTTARHVFDQLEGRIPYILDGGPCTVGVESTIVGFEGPETVVHRLGGLSLEALEAVAGPIRLDLNQSSNPAAPGMLASHYAPKKPFAAGAFSIVDGQLRFNGAAVKMDKRVGIIRFSNSGGEIRHSTAIKSIVLSPKGDVTQAAQQLFAALREMDQSDADLILAEWAPEEGLGRAINDRLRRASAV